MIAPIKGGWLTQNNQALGLGELTSVENDSIIPQCWGSSGFKGSPTTNLGNIGHQTIMEMLQMAGRRDENR